MTTRPTRKNNKNAARPGAKGGKGKPKGKAPGKQPESSPLRMDPVDSILKSREREREEMLEARRELREMVQESQLRILAMRTKGNLARWKIINKGFDD
ncbi:hypothetical protein JST97_14610 [bacterium]|nr:hypothetical protein [bacterium]